MEPPGILAAILVIAVVFVIGSIIEGRGWAKVIAMALTVVAMAETLYNFLRDRLQ